MRSLLLIALCLLAVLTAALIVVLGVSFVDVLTQVSSWRPHLVSWTLAPMGAALGVLVAALAALAVALHKISGEP